MSALDVTVRVGALFSEHDVAALPPGQQQQWVALAQCPACTSGDVHVLTSIENRDREPFLQKSVCARCRHVFFSRMPGSQFFVDYYTNTFGRNKATPRVTPYYPYTPISDLLGGYVDRSARILDVGCGYGAALKHLTGLGYTRLVGLEPSTLRAEVAARSGFEILPMTTDGLSRSVHGEFDCAYSWHAFEHIYDIDAAIASVKSVLKPAGWLFIAVPHYEAEHIVDIAHFLPHIHNFNEQSLRALLERHGFDIVHLDPSLRVLARLRGEGQAVARSTDDLDRVLTRKVQRDFDLRGRRLDGPFAARLSTSKYRGSDEILEPSFGILRPLNGREGWIFQNAAVRRTLRHKRLGRLWRRLFGRYIAGTFSVQQGTDPIPRTTFVYPTRAVSILMK